MRPILVVTILLLGLSAAAPEPDYSSYFTDYLHAADRTAEASFIEIESSIGRADRLATVSPQPHVVAVETLTPADARASADINSNGPDSTDTDSASGRDGDVSLNDLCNALYTSAQDNDLPVPFFANLIWQESRLREDAVSRKGALGIAQFMPETAAESGLDNPFDALQAIPASAHFLRELHLEFGNLGFVAAAYNAGARRVIEWLEHRGSLPRETRGYVVRVTGLSVDAWRSMAVNDDALTFVQRLPCRSLPAFASVEQAQSEQAQLQLAKVEKAAEAASKPHGEHVAERKRRRGNHERHEARRAEHERAGRRTADRHGRHDRDKHKSV
jgi:soluble lytic murein transglycosylase-like protein